ncbi:MAG: Ig-like domain-containing protein [Gammaproteobacteria bacterium]|nr:Ig-like domain-containing protein [Gammaproteobacteria bacterium]
MSACGGGGGGNATPQNASPVVIITAPSADPNYTAGTGTITIAGTATDDTGVTEVSWTNSAGGAGTASGTTTWSYSGLQLQNGTNIITVTARDSSNNSSTDVITVSYDAANVTPPQITISQPSANPTYTANTGTITIAGTASDDTTVTEVTWVNSTGGTGTADGTTNWSYSGLQLQAGANVITVTARDADNNTSTDVITVTYNVVDNSLPQISITSPEDDGTYTSGTDVVSISGASSDNVGVTRIKYSNNGGPDVNTLTRNPWYFNNIPLVSGTNRIVVTAYDAANNQSSATITVTYQENQAAETCMSCHNGSNRNDYAGGGLENPHPFAGAQNIYCTVCHGGNGQGAGKEGSHVPPPPAMSTAQQLINDPVAYFNRLTLAGIDKYPDYTVNGVTYTAIDYLQFINPGDLRVVTQGRSCGNCHEDHTDWVSRNVLATEAGILSGAMYAAGIENSILEHRGLYQDTAADEGFRYVSNPDFNQFTASIGGIRKVNEFPVISQYNGQTTSGIPLVQGGILNNFYNAANLVNDLYTAAEENGAKTNRVRENSALAALYHEQIAFTCGDCHLGSAGANNRFGDFRSSGCTACHMAYSLDGRSRSNDPNVNTEEPVNPDAIAAPERPHIRMHIIQNVAKTLPNNSFVTGIQDMACAGCHQGSNRTVMQYWGIRLDQNADLVNNFQYPANPNTFVNTAADTRLFDPAVNNNTFNGRNANQYIAFEDYDGDGRDDTPADIHHEAGLGCIDCHGSRDLHGGSVTDPTSGQIMSRQDQVTAISCSNCHGSIAAYATTKSCLTYDDVEAECAMDSKGNPLRHVTRDPSGNFYLISRLDGQRHYIPQTRDTIINNNKINPSTNQLVYSAKASYAMGRADGDIATGTGPIQNNPLLYTNGFSHTDSMDCVSCHAAWTNNCIGCHLGGEFDNNPNNYRFSNITGERIAFNQTAADFTYISPVPFTLGVSSENKITQMSPAEKTFFRFFDGNTLSQVFVFSDRNGDGNNPNTGGRNAFPASSHNVMMPHSIRGKVSATNEGPRYCVACHLNVDQIANFNANGEYTTFFTNMANNNFAGLDFNLLQQQIGLNTGNQLNSPYFVHMAAGLGTGLFLFDATGCPVNPLDNNANRHYCPNGAPAANFDANTVNNVAVYNLDRIVQATGISNASNNHPMKNPGAGGNYRGGSLNQNMSGPLGGVYIQKLADPNTGLILDSWLDANGNPQGNAANFLR